MSTPTDQDLARILRSARTIAVLGAHQETARAAFYVPDYLFEQGYRILPVNPALKGATLWCEPIRASLAELGEPVDIVDVFRRSDLVPGHLDDLLAMRPRPRVVWMQLGVRSDDVARRLEAEGIEVVQDRCTLADHRRLGIGRVG
jgi:hypothetical protein